MTHSIDWSVVTNVHVMTAINDYDRLGAAQFFAEHGFAPATTYDLLWNGRRYPPKAVLGRAYELATGRRLASSDFEGGKAGAVKVLSRLGFTVEPKVG
jgi:hypothetical protein